MKLEDDVGGDGNGVVVFVDHVEYIAITSDFSLISVPGGCLFGHQLAKAAFGSGNIFDAIGCTGTLNFRDLYENVERGGGSFESSLLPSSKLPYVSEGAYGFRRHELLQGALVVELRHQYLRHLSNIFVIKMVFGEDIISLSKILSCLKCFKSRTVRILGCLVESARIRGLLSYTPPR